MELVVTNQPGERERVVAALEALTRQYQLPASVRQAADLALEEHLTNIARYAYADGKIHEVVIRLEVGPHDLLVEVADDGKPFDPLERPEVDTSVPLESKPVGGLGIHLMRRFMDELKYRRAEGRNILTMRKRLNSSPPGLGPG